LYKVGNLLGASWNYLTANSFDECVQQCLNRAGCNGVNYLEPQRACSILNVGIRDITVVDPSTYDRVPNVIHAYVGCARKASVGCGRQAPQYQPNLTRFKRIIGGYEARAHSWPWLVTLNIAQGEGHICGASLLRVSENSEESDILLTAAHCVTQEKTMATNPVAFSPSQVTATAGNHHHYTVEAGEVNRQVVQIRFHSGFRFTAKYGAPNDLAVLKLATPIPFSDTIRPICLPAAGEPIPTSKTCVVAGWGRNSSRNPNEYPISLQQLVMQVHPPSTCLGTTWGSVYREDQMICAGSLQGTSSTCRGDAGGALACQQADGSWTLYGSTSFYVSGCLKANSPPIFARVSQYIS